MERYLSILSERNFMHFYHETRARYINGYGARSAEAWIRISICMETSCEEKWRNCS